jgi:predicted RNA polymerase sigma factor
MRAPTPAPYALQAAISAEHATSAGFADTDWSRIIDLYSSLLGHPPNPTFAVGRAVVIGHAVSAAAGLADLDELASTPSLSGYAYLHAARADCLGRLGLVDESKAAYLRAAQCARNGAERAFFTQKKLKDRWPPGPPDR